MGAAAAPSPDVEVVVLVAAAAPPAAAEPPNSAASSGLAEGLPCADIAAFIIGSCCKGREVIVLFQGVV